MSIITTGTTSTTGLIHTSDTNGNLVVKTGSSATTALTVGSNQVVDFVATPTINGAAFPSGAMSLISTQTANGGQYLNFTNIGTYKQYVLFYSNLTDSANNNYYLNFGTGSSPTWQTSSYQYQCLGVYGTNQLTNNSSNAAGILLMINGNYQAFGNSGQIIFGNLSNTTQYKTAFNSMAYSNSSGSFMLMQSSGSWTGGTNAITALRIDSQGSFTSGSASLYGLSS